MFQRLSIAPTQVKGCNTSKNVLNIMRKSYILCIEQRKLLKKYVTI